MFPTHTPTNQHIFRSSQHPCCLLVLVSHHHLHLCIGLVPYSHSCHRDEHLVAHDDEGTEVAKLKRDYN